MHVHHIAIAVHDLDAALAFYRDALGMIEGTAGRYQQREWRSLFCRWVSRRSNF